MNEKDILREIHDSFEASGKNLPDTFPCGNELDFPEERAIVVQSRKKYFPAIASCAAVAVISALAVNGFASQKNTLTANRPEQDMFIAESVTTSEETSSVQQTESAVLSETTTFTVTEITEKADGKDFVTETYMQTVKASEPTVQQTAAVTQEPPVSRAASAETHPSETVSETTADSKVNSAEAQNPVTPSETVSEPVDMTVSEEPEVTVDISDYEFIRAELISNPSWSAGSSASYLEIEGSEYIYVIENPDRYLVRIYFGNTSETFSLIRILNLRIVTADELIESGLPYADKYLK